jgi:hypothetical protein
MTTRKGAVRHGYTMADIDGIARSAFVADRSMASDADTRYSVAWSAVAEALCAAQDRPSRQDLVRVGWQAIYAEVREMRHTYGQQRDDPNAPVASMPKAQQYWFTPPVDTAGDRLERIAVHQIMATLGEPYRDAVIALAVHEDYKRAAEALGIKYSTLTVRLTTARKKFRRHWFAPEAAPAIKGTDRRAESHSATLATHCIQGHEMTGDNARARVGKRKGRTCRACERERDAARRALKKAVS